jgi:hypothetical protein
MRQGNWLQRYAPIANYPLARLHPALPGHTPFARGNGVRFGGPAAIRWLILDKVEVFCGFWIGDQMGSVANPFDPMRCRQYAAATSIFAVAGGYQMANDGPKHKLVAILAADIVGFSRMMEADQAGTHSQLGTHRKEVVNPAIEEAMVGLAEHNGILEHTSGSVDLSTNSRLMADNVPAASSVVSAAELVR